MEANQRDDEKDSYSWLLSEENGNKRRRTDGEESIWKETRTKVIRVYEVDLHNFKDLVQLLTGQPNPQNQNPRNSSSFK